MQSHAKPSETVGPSIHSLVVQAQIAAAVLTCMHGAPWATSLGATFQWASLPRFWGFLPPGKAKLAPSVGVADRMRPPTPQSPASGGGPAGYLKVSMPSAHWDSHLLVLLSTHTHHAAMSDLRVPVRVERVGWVGG